MATDEILKKRVVDQLAWDTRVDASNIQVSAENGIITLTGTVSSYYQRGISEDIAWAITGVVSVDNSLDVEFAETLSVPSDDEIQSWVEQKLRWNTNIDESAITVNVAGGLVTLEGTVPTFWQYTSAKSEADQTTGVIDVTNKLAVVPTEKVTDKVIGERVMERIEQNTLADIDDLEVKVEDGEVTLYGNIPSWTTWRAVYDAAQFTTGVTGVKDHTKISYA